MQKYIIISYLHCSSCNSPHQQREGNWSRKLRPSMVSGPSFHKARDFVTHPETRVKALSVERLSITFTANGKREFVPRDQVFS